MFPIATERLILRPWRSEDFAPFAALNADPEVRKYWTSTLAKAESDAQAEAFQQHIQARGFGFWALEAPGVAPFIGFAGLMRAGPELPFAPAVEAGWRLARSFWGRGYATEAVRAALDDGFGRLKLAEIVAYAVEANAPSRRVMERLGMTHDPSDDFDRKDLEPGHPLRRRVVYRKTRPVR